MEGLPSATSESRPAYKLHLNPGDMTPEEQARQFRASFEVENHPSKRPFQLSLIEEEFNEFVEAQARIDEGGEGAADCLKELADLVYVAYQFAANEGWPLDQALLRVHVSNMSKLGPAGRPVRRTDGKVLKGYHYKPPFLNDLVDNTALAAN